jgi:hypothetical protein
LDSLTDVVESITRGERLKRYVLFVQVRMVTGDSAVTAKAIAAECGILTEGGKVVEGRDVRNYTKAEFDRELEHIDVRNFLLDSDMLAHFVTLEPCCPSDVSLT